VPTNIVVPELGESVVEARVAKWLKSEGDAVAAGEPLVELETETIDLEVSADRSGVLGAIKHPAGADVKVGEVLATLDDWATGPADPGPAQQAPATASTSPAQKATPTARNVARDRNVPLDSVSGSGARGRVTKQDVLNAGGAGPGAPAGPAARAAPAAPAAPVAPAAPDAPVAPVSRPREDRVRMSKRRETIARRLVEAQHSAAMLTTFNEVDMTAVMSVRERRKDTFQKKYGVGLGIASFFVKATVAALRAFPPLNAEIDGTDIIYKRYYDIGVAVGAEGGLVVPVLRDADRMSFVEIELAIRDVAKRANEGTLTLEDLRGGTFTITNGGVFGSLMSTPILNPPQVGILGLHKIADRSVPLDGAVVIRPMMYVALSYDHRLVDGREAVQFLVKVKEYVEDPAWLLLEG
jgi:2-oxoglutarate dehydrogenase E2 component (dihydrolipoamide succinyltransferase)